MTRTTQHDLDVQLRSLNLRLGRPEEREAAAFLAVAEATERAIAAGRPQCPRCGQTFRRTGTGYGWHVQNRPQCAQRRAEVAS